MMTPTWRDAPGSSSPPGVMHSLPLGVRQLLSRPVLVPLGLPIGISLPSAVPLATQGEPPVHHALVSTDRIPLKLALEVM